MPSSCSESRPDFLRPARIGGRVFPGNVFLAPMAGFTDPPMRSVCIAGGAPLAYTEMISAEGLIRNGRKTSRLLERAANETTLAVQIFTAEPDTAARCAEKLMEFDPALLDLNCGCPVPKVIKHGAGSALLNTPESIYRILRAMRESSSVPVTVKIRSGWDAASINFIETGKAAQEAGAAMLCLHARTRAQAYSGTAEYAHIRDLKQSLSIPVFGSGDLHAPEDVEKMFLQTGCDGVMIARGAIGNPFIFSQIEQYLKTGAYSRPDKRARLDMALRQLDLCAAYKGEWTACREMRKHFCAYSRGLPGGAELRRAFVGAESIAHYRAITAEYLAGVDARKG